MEKVFIGKNGKPYSIEELEIGNLLRNTELLEMYSMNELDTLIRKYFGNKTRVYPLLLSEKIKIYDSSDEVNSFFLNDQKLWLDKATRVGLMHLVNCSDDFVKVALGDQVLTFSIEDAKTFLIKLERYASQCYLVTQQHLSAAKQLTGEEALNYDYTTGYPDKIKLK